MIDTLYSLIDKPMPLPTAKHPLRSKTCWLNGLTFLAAAVALLAGSDLVAEHPRIVSALVLAGALLNLGLRFVTDQAIDLHPPSHRSRIWLAAAIVLCVSPLWAGEPWTEARLKAHFDAGPKLPLSFKTLKPGDGSSAWYVRLETSDAGHVAHVWPRNAATEKRARQMAVSSEGHLRNPAYQWRPIKAESWGMTAAEVKEVKPSGRPAQTEGGG